MVVEVELINGDFFLEPGIIETQLDSALPSSVDFNLSETV
jgi:hypothetical protein